VSATEWLVIGGGLAVIVWLNWYFLFADRGKRSAQENAGKSKQPPK
jgi:hypothetical protein